MRLSFIVAGCALAALSANGHAQSYGVAEVTDGNLKFTATLTGVGTAAGHMLSGTKCEVAFSISVTTGPAGGGSTHIYESWGMVTPSLKIGTTNIPGIPDAPDPGEPYGTTVRFASNHFNHNENIPIEGKIYVFGIDKDAGGNVIGVGDVHELKPEVLPKAYNVGRCWGTSVNADGTPSIMFKGSNAFEAKAACTDFYSKQVTPYKHDPPTADSPDFLLRQDLIGHTLRDRLFEATLVHASTHGTELGMADSYSAAIIPFVNGIDTFVAQHVSGAPRQTPMPNFVSAYTCQSVNSDKTGAKAFGIVTGIGSTIPDKAYVGFPEIIVSNTVDGPGKRVWFLSDSSIALHGALADGAPLYKAVKDANLFKVFQVSIIAAHEDVEPVPLTIVGDTDFRLVNVYMTIAEVEMYGALVDTWYLVL